MNLQSFRLRRFLLSEKCFFSRKFSSLSNKEFLVERLENENQGIVTFTMARPSARNALGKQLIQEFRQAIEDVRFDPSVRCIILQSSVPKVFCAGADLKERLNMSESEAAAATFQFRDVFLQLEQLPMPTIAAIEGFALGGGLEMALACDFRIASESATLGTPETSLAIIPGAGGTQRLPRLIGLAKAKKLIFTCRKLNSQQACDIGLVDYSVEKDKAFSAALKLAQEILPQGPLAIRMAKEAINKGMEVDTNTGMAIERNCYAQIIPTADRTEGLLAFKEKRKPVYKGK